jgi:hypothetical protein
MSRKPVPSFSRQEADILPQAVCPEDGRFLDLGPALSHSLKRLRRRPSPVHVNIVANDAVNEQRHCRRRIVARFFASIFFFYITEKHAFGPRVIIERIPDIQPMDNVRLRHAVLTIIWADLRPLGKLWLFHQALHNYVRREPWKFTLVRAGGRLCALWLYG